MSPTERTWLPVWFVAQLVLSLAAVVLFLLCAKDPAPEGKVSPVVFGALIVVMLPFMGALPAQRFYECRGNELAAWLYVMLPAALCPAPVCVAFCLTAEVQPDGTTVLLASGAVPMGVAVLSYSLAAVVVTLLAARFPAHAGMGPAAGLDEAAAGTLSSREEHWRRRPDAL